jgi:ankyrin repeat protein
VNLLVDSGASDVDVNVDVEVDENETPLYFASQGGHEEVVKLLLKLGADPAKYSNVK